jgi:hypothetical protein
MTSRRRPDRQREYPKSHTGSAPSPDKERHEGEDRHHPEDHPHPHPKHRPTKKTALPPRHHPHTKPEGQDLNVDHGTHEDRPQPAKIFRKAAKK